MELKKGSLVRSARFGLGRVAFVEGEPTVVVRFEHGLEECERTSLEILRAVVDVAAEPSWDVPIEVIARAQALAIRSVNDTWGVFSRSRIELLPHQLWVCKTVIERWPCRWLVADDVGLGKTIEAGLILWPLLARGTVKRVLIVCPASLTEQWQDRLFRMFDIRMTVYSSASDGPRSTFWAASDQVIASLQTMRARNEGRLDRFFAAEPWDLVIVDEAHHLNSAEESATLGYRFLERLVKEDRVRSLVFFTATPHRGKDYGFLSLLHLLRPDLFDPDKDVDAQLTKLPAVMIRNNKQDVTDLSGNRIFRAPRVSQTTFDYSPEEAAFYEKLTEFIASGRAYASSLDATAGNAVMLVLIAMQKLAASSVAAIRRAIANRLDRIAKQSREVASLSESIEAYATAEAEADFERQARLEEELAQAKLALRLMENEQEALSELLASADAIERETKIDRILELISTRFANRSVLIFTEYKATQSLLLSALLRTYGPDSATFINGDGEARDVVQPDGTLVTLTRSRHDAADAFNAGKVRFLVSTEAAGEGIDLQRSCHTLIHADLPWNPMRLHQRVGRLNRYGQHQQVEVVVVHNPSTVESRIYLKLTEKLGRINAALAQAMKTPEDMSELVLGMTSPSLFRSLFTEARDVAPASLDDWFDRKTKSFGGKDVLDTVKALVGHASKFDFRDISPRLPRVDLPDLKPFLVTMLSLNHRQVTEDAGLSFRTPDDWRKAPGVAPAYSNMTFRRDEHDLDLQRRLLGVGHKIIDLALTQALASSRCLASLPREVLERPLAIYVARDRVTGNETAARGIVIAVEADEAGALRSIADWQLLQRLNALSGRKAFHRDESPRALDPSSLEAELAKMEAFARNELGSLDHPFRHPTLELVAALWPTDESRRKASAVSPKILA